MKLKTKVWTATFAATMVSILAMGGVEVVVSRTKVSPEAIELSVIHADHAVERAWKLPAAASFRHARSSARHETAGTEFSPGDRKSVV